MGRIRVLDDSLVNRIAAGEVVERPASVVKELLENAIDAGAGRIAVTLAGGGKRLVRVTDDGQGMDRDDALLSLERHATSKLSRAEDLHAIASLGFRGEALPSIAAVSRFLMRTAAREGEGTEIEVRGGRILSVRQVGAARGTTVEVAGLFFNVPARRKFLRSEATELSHVARIVTRLALARPTLGFRLDHDGRCLLDLPPGSGLEERAGRLLGREFAERLLSFRLERQQAAAFGLAGRPVDASPRRDSQFVFVNGRAVLDRTLSHALVEAYGNTVPRDRHPPVIAFLTVPAQDVDVNVHPQKIEVRFARPGEAHDLLRDAVASALGGGRAVPRLAELRPEGEAREVAVAEAIERYLDRRANEAAEVAVAGAESARFAAPAPPPSAPAYATEEPQGLLERGAPAPLAQFRDSYVIAEDRDGLVIVDQHAAHERILFERYLAEAEQNRVESQPLLFPLALEMAPHERVLLEEEIEEFLRLGFRLEPFGGDTVRIDAVPAVLQGLEPGAVLRELVGEAAKARSATAAAEPLRLRLVTTAACRAAIKVNRALSPTEMRELLEALMRCSSPTTCPHGRPVMFRMSLADLERAFRRR